MLATASACETILNAMAAREVVRRRFLAFVRAHDFGGAAFFLARAFRETQEAGKARTLLRV